MSLHKEFKFMFGLYHWPSQGNNLGHLAMKFKYPVSFIGPHNLTGKASLEDNLETEDLWTVKTYWKDI